MIKDNKIITEIDIYDLLDELSLKEKKELILHLSCEDEVIQNVADQLIHGCTETGWHGGVANSEPPSTPLDNAVREISVNASDIAKKEIENLKRKIKSLEERKDKGWDEYHKLIKRGY